MVWLPTRRPHAGVKSTAPFARIWVPRVVVPSRKVTAPVGVPAAGLTAETAALNVTGSPRAAGFGDELSVTVAAARTTCARVAEVAAAKLLFPE